MRIGLGLSLSRLKSGSGSYGYRVMNTAPANLLGYWPLSEAAGTIAYNVGGGGSVRNGTYSGNVTPGQTGIGDGQTAPSFTGGLVNIYSASLSSAYDPTNATIAAWLKVSAPGVWTDGSQRVGLFLFSAANNQFYIGRHTVNNQLRCTYRGSGTAKDVIATSTAFTGYFHVALVLDKAGDTLKAYLNGSQLGSTQTSLPVWNGTGLGSTGCCIGSASTTPTLTWSGNIAHAAVWNTQLSVPQILALATI